MEIGKILKTPLKYIILFLLSCTNIITYFYIQPWVIFYLFSFDSLNFILILYIFIFFSIYEISKGLFSQFWNKFTRIFGIHISVSISLFLISFFNSTFSIKTLFKDVFISSCFILIPFKLSLKKVICSFLLFKS